MVGIKGVGMASLAILLKGLGSHVEGSDVEEYFHTQEDLKKSGIEFLPGFSNEHITTSIDLVITTGAHGGLHNIEVLEARKKNIPVLTHAEALGEVMKEFKNRIAVCGSHGKTTSTAFIAHTLKQLELEPAAIIGSAHNEYSNFRKEYIVVEADEYAAAPPENKTARFMYMNPTQIVCTNIDFDHPDVYTDIAHTKKVFEEFFNKVKDDGRIIACGDNQHIIEILSKFPKNTYITYGLESYNDLVITNIKGCENGTHFNAIFKNELKPHEYFISLYGVHNVLNAASVILSGNAFGIDVSKVKKSISTFKGTKRRMELIFNQNNTFLFDDYGHHPVEINATLKTFKTRFPHNRLLVIFQPHTASRTKAFEKDFIDCLEIADKSYITDIFLSAREKTESDHITSQNVANKSRTQGNRLTYCNLNDIISTLRNEIKSGDIVVTMGAGDLYKYHSDIIRAIKEINN